MKKEKVEFSEEQTLDACIRQLEAIVEGLKAGTLRLSQGDDKLWLRPGAAVGLELRAEQVGGRESLDIHLAWDRRSLQPVARLDDAPPQTVRNWQRTHQEGDADHVVAPNDDTRAMRNLDSASVGRYQEAYAASRVPDAEGQQRLDERRFEELLAGLGVDARAQQTLVELAKRADAAGRPALFEADIIAALRKAS